MDITVVFAFSYIIHIVGSEQTITVAQSVVVESSRVYVAGYLSLVAERATQLFCATKR